MGVNPESQPQPAKKAQMYSLVRVCVQARTVTHYLFMLMCHTGCLIAAGGT